MKAARTLTAALWALFLAVGLSGCAGAPQRVLVPVQVPCRVDPPKPPVWATSRLAADAGIWEQAKALLAERRQRIAYEGQLEAALAACNEALPPALGALRK